MASERKYTPVQLFPTIINRGAFYNRDHPVINPAKEEYIKYWRQEKRRCIEGKWVQEAENHWRWMNPTLYHYINHWEILIVDEKNKSRYNAPPIMDDNEWIMSTYITCCYGFSGFSEDEQYSCDRLLYKYFAEKRDETDEYGEVIRLTSYEKRQLEQNKYLKKPDGTYKEYIPPYEYLCRHHEKPKGFHMYNNEPLNGMIFTARSNGKDLEENTLVWTPEGRVEIKYIKVGDVIVGGDGKLTTVTSVFNYTDQVQFHITLSSGRSVECGEGHLWKVKNLRDNRYEVLEFKEILAEIENYLIPVLNEVYEEIESVYVVGVKPSVCIGVDNVDKLFYVNDGIITHNSFTISSESGRIFSFDGMRYYDNKEFSTPSNIIGEVMLGASDPTKTMELAVKVEHGLLNYKGGYISSDAFKPSPFFKRAKGSIAVGETYINQYRHQIKGNWVKKGKGSKIYTVNYGTDVQAGASKRLTLEVVDEIGLLKNADEAHGVSKHSKSGGGSRYGISIKLGTGGSIEKVDAAKRMFYGPSTYDIYPMPDRWENKGNTGLFMPAYYSLRKHKDANGNTIFDEALEELLIERKRLAHSADPLPLIQEKMFMPIVPSEMFYSVGENILPSGLALERINEIEEDKLWDAQASVGHFAWGDVKKGSVKWVESPSKRKNVIKDMMMDKYADKTGVFVIYEHPFLDSIEKGLYKVVYDPYAVDGKGESYASILVYKGVPLNPQNTGPMRNNIVGEFIGRPITVEDAHIIAIQAAMYFKTTVLPEVNTKGFYDYCKREGYFNLLQKEPFKTVKDANPTIAKRSKIGVTMNATLKQYALQLYRSWLLEPVGMEVHNEEMQDMKYTIHTLWASRLLYETADFDPAGNYDHISAVLLLMLWLNESGKESIPEKTNKDESKFEDFASRRKAMLYNPALR